jgi:hypothetical protein
MNAYDKVLLYSGLAAVILALSLLTAHWLGKLTITGGGLGHLVVGLIVGVGLLLRGVAAWRVARAGKVSDPPHETIPSSKVQ